MKLTNINFLMKMTKDYLDGKIDYYTYGLDFTYEVELRYSKMIKESRDLAEYIFDYLDQEGASMYSILSEEEFRARILNGYECVMDTINGDVDIF